MRRALPRLAGRATAGGAARAGGEAWGAYDAKAVKDAHIAGARERVFGPQGNMPGDRYWRKKLEGKELMQWYFPSKYNLQDFRADDYFEMQAERFAPREAHECMPGLTEMLEKVSERREALRSLFGALDEPTFLENPTLQDLYGLFRLVDPDPALPFTPPRAAFAEHSPLFGPRPPFRAFASEAAEEEEGAHELHALLLVLKARLGKDAASALEARLARLRSLGAVREVLLEEASRLNAVVPFERLTVAVEELEVEASSASSTASAAPRQRPARGEEATAEAAAKPGAEPAAEAAAEAARLTSEQEQEAVVTQEPSTGGTEEEVDPFAGFLGTWSYGPEGTFEVFRGEDGEVQLSGQVIRGVDVSGRLAPDDGALLGELRRCADGEAVSEVKLRMAGDAPDAGLLAFRRPGKTAWAKDRLVQLVEPAVRPPMPAEEEAMAEAKAAAEAAEAKERQEAGGEAEEEEEKAMKGQGSEEDGYDDQSDEGGFMFSEPDLRVPQVRLRLQAYAAQHQLGGPADNLARERKKEAEAELARLRSKGPPVMRKYLARRHRFIDPMYRRRRLKWIERTISSERNKEKELKFNSYYTVHPDDQKDWPTNKGSVTVQWPSPYH